MSATLGLAAVSYSSVARDLREARFTPSKPAPSPADVQKDLDDSCQALLAALEDSPFASVRQLSRLTHFPSTTVYRCLTQSLGFLAHHLRWVPHALSDAQKGARVNLSRLLLRILEVQGDRAQHDIVTLDESWFHLGTDYEFVWLRQYEKFPKENDRQFNQKIPAHCPNGTKLKQWATSENCWCMRIMRARTPPSYQFNILTRIK
jgi:hypothetical protein